MVLGASFDPVDDNRAFAEKFDYPFRLLSDLDEQVGVAYAVRDAGTDKINFAKRYAYLIGPDGVIVKSYDVGRGTAEFAANVLADLFRYFGGVAGEVKGTTLPAGSTQLQYTRQEPLGVVGGILPWNSPLMIAGFKVPAALAEIGRAHV